MHDQIRAFLTDRLRAEILTSAHFDELCRLHRDSQVMRTLSADGNILTDEATRRSLIQGEEHWERNGFGLWIFRDRTNGNFVGRGGLKIYPINERDQVGLAYAVVSDLRGLGYATEMAEASLSIGFNFLGFREVASCTLPINRASQRVMEKLGFCYECDIEFAGLRHGYYRLRSSDWRARPSTLVLQPIDDFDSDG